MLFNNKNNFTVIILLLANVLKSIFIIQHFLMNIFILFIAFSVEDFKIMKQNVFKNYTFLFENLQNFLA